MYSASEPLATQSFKRKFGLDGHALAWIGLRSLGWGTAHFIVLLDWNSSLDV